MPLHVFWITQVKFYARPFDISCMGKWIPRLDTRLFNFPYTYLSASKIRGEKSVYLRYQIFALAKSEARWDNQHDTKNKVQNKWRIKLALLLI